jgi:hypothetical protein
LKGGSGGKSGGRSQAGRPISDRGADFEDVAAFIAREFPAADQLILRYFGFSCLLPISNTGFWKKWDKNSRLRNFVPLFEIFPF